MRLLPVRAGIRHLVVTGPDTSGLGPCSTDVLCALAEARRLGAAAGFLRPTETWPPALAQLTTDIPRRALTGPVGLWCRAHWRRASMARRFSAWRRERVLSVRRELARELRRHAGNERVPAGVRTHLKDAARVVGHPAPRAARPGFPRRLLRERVQVSLDREARARADNEAKAAGIPRDRPLVAFEVPHRVESALPAIAFLIEHGYVVVRIGDPRGGHVDVAGVVDLACAPQPNPLLELLVLQSARFLVCESLDLQQAAYLTGTPTLTLNARDPISRYPIRRDGMFTLTRALDLDSGRVIPLHERLEGRFFHNDRNLGHTPNLPGTILDAVREMHEGTAVAWRDTAEQAAFRTAAAQASAELAPSVPLVAEWGADAGFIGDGRLAQTQAKTLAPGARSPEPGTGGGS
jgi:putative glycosyltransferase (TIGR04372 family)